MRLPFRWGRVRRGRRFGQDGFGHGWIAEETYEQVLSAGPLGRVLAHGFFDKQTQLVIQAIKAGLGVHGSVQQGVGRPLPERKAAGARIEDDATPGEDVHRGCDLVSDDLFRRHEARGSDPLLFAADRGERRCARHPKVDHFGPHGGNKHIGRCEVTMSHASVVDGGERGRNIHGEQFEVCRA